MCLASYLVEVETTQLLRNGGSDDRRDAFSRHKLTGSKNVYFKGILNFLSLTQDAGKSYNAQLRHLRLRHYFPFDEQRNYLLLRHKLAEYR